MLLFSTTLLSILALSLGREFIFNSKSDQRYWISYLDSLKEYEQFVIDSTREEVLGNGPYNPNELNIEEWISLGLDYGSASRITKYVEAGGSIQDEQDLSRLNLGDSTWRNEVGSHLIWQEGERKGTLEVKFEASRMQQKMEVQTPDSIALYHSGLSPFVINRWKRYLSAGGRIDSLSDLESIYGMDESWLALNRDQLVYPEPVVRQMISINLIEMKDFAIQCDCPLWMAERFMSYRDRLGGFVSKDQLYEVGLDSSTVDRMIIWIDVAGEVQQVNLNSWSVEELASHPYIGWELAKSIEFFRSRVRPIESVDDLKGMEGYEEGRLNLLKYYLQK